jgi:hypothetical protein
LARNFALWAQIPLSWEKNPQTRAGLETRILTCTQWEFRFEGDVPAELRIGSFLLLLVADWERKKPRLRR